MKEHKQTVGKFIMKMGNLKTNQFFQEGKQNGGGDFITIMAIRRNGDFGWQEELESGWYHTNVARVLYRKIPIPTGS
jgi:hypothetical protein